MKLQTLLIIFLIISMLFTINVNAMEIEETTAIETTEEITEIEEESTLDVLKRIEAILTVIEFTGIFAILIHYSEKWLKALLEGIKRETGG